MREFFYEIRLVFFWSNTQPRVHDRISYGLLCRVRDHKYNASWTVVSYYDRFSVVDKGMSVTLSKQLTSNNCAVQKCFSLTV